MQIFYFLNSNSCQQHRKLISLSAANQDKQNHQRHGKGKHICCGGDCMEDLNLYLKDVLTERPHTRVPENFAIYKTNFTEKSRNLMTSDIQC